MIGGEQMQVSIKKENYNAIIRAGYEDVSGFVNSAISEKLSKKKKED